MTARILMTAVAAALLWLSTLSGCAKPAAHRDGESTAKAGAQTSPWSARGLNAIPGKVFQAYALVLMRSGSALMGSRAILETQYVEQFLDIVHAVIEMGSDEDRVSPDADVDS